MGARVHTESGSSTKSGASRVRYGDEVRAARAAGAPIVALESNVIAQGLPYPANLAAARDVEQAVRAAGAVPATIAVLDGLLVAGLSDTELDLLATADRIPKLSTRDLPVCMARRGTGATTIAATMAIADQAGIDIVSSAGLGGVHRDVAETMDVSADLTQLVRSRVLVVSAGVKSILDLPKTLEFLETFGVPVVAYRSDDFPAFYVRSSGLRSPARIDDPYELAAAARLHWSMGGTGGLLVTHPIPEHLALDRDEVEAAIAAAQLAARREGVTGAKVTRFLLDAVDTATGGRARRANADVLISNAEVAAELAVAYAGSRDTVPNTAEFAGSVR